MFKFNRHLLILNLCCLSAIASEQIADPTRPLGQSNLSVNAEGSAEGGLKLTSILISENRKIAIINGEILQEQQSLKGTKILVTKISADEVKLQEGSNHWSLKFHDTSVRH